MNILNQALAELEAGNEAIAWTIAKMDEGLLPGVTKAQWLAFARKAIADRKERENIRSQIVD
jgi:TctA family transporter